MKKIKDVLTEKGFVEDVDYTLRGKEVVALEKTRMVDKIIDHPEIPEIKDENGVIIQEYKAAWQETIQVEEKFFPDIPSTERLMADCLKSVDVMAIVSHYLENHTRPQGDLNIWLFLDGGDGWRITNIPAPRIETLYDMADESFARITQEQINAEAEAYLASTDKWIIRKVETGVEVPAEITQKRAEARAKVVKPEKVKA